MKMAAFFPLSILIACVIGRYEAVHLPEEFLSTPELVKYWGYPVETHEAVTKDGYILTLHRIPHGKKNYTGRKTRPAFYLQHTVLSSSADWVINLPNQSLGFVLADEGFDVWMGNVRGNVYSRKHATRKITSKEFWDFTIDEHSKYDFPAMINYILNKTGQEKLYYVGHSQGSVMAHAGLVETPELQSKIKVYFALAPISRMNHVNGDVKSMASWESELAFVFRLFRIREFYHSSKWSKRLYGTVCQLVPMFCKSMMDLIQGGKDQKQINSTRLPIYVAHTPAGMSSKNVLHWMQLINSKLFRKYDYGEKGNMEHYKTKLPPEYDIAKIHAPTVIFAGGKDTLAPPEDVKWTHGHLGSVIKMFEVKEYSHMDFVWGTASSKTLYDKMKFYIDI